LRATVDTNVWISSLLSRAGAPARLRRAYQAGSFTAVVSERLLAELESVLARPRFARLGIDAREAQELLAVLRDVGVMAPVEGAVRVCRDPKDDVVIETAIAGQADVIVSGDKDLTGMAEVAQYLAKAGIRVLTVAQFLRELNLPEEEPDDTEP
jgi:putative PIN family toxin of toxin-antitoxin system